MVNVDGVVLGNFRTGIGGRDLNRVFHKPAIYAEINILKNIAQECKP
jgi:murein tripeptide amidase MpaA